MNKRQKIVQQQFLDNEEAVVRKLKNQYHHALKEIEKKAQSLQDDINRLGTLANLATDEEEKAKFLSMQQSKVYQKQYQDALKTQISSILDNMQVEEFKTVSEYLQKCYEDGFIGTMYDLQGQGIPLCFPLDQEAMVRAVQTDSKISQGLYTRLGEDVSVLKKKITSEISRGVATGMAFQQVAKQLASHTNIGYNRAVRIARTEGHRIQIQGTMDACYKAKEKGANVVKQWDATLDARTRDSHVAVDGEIKELDEPFSNGLMFPGDPSGGAAEVVNCRCALHQRGKWSLDKRINPETGKEEYYDGSFTKMNNFTKQLETFKSPEEYAEFKKAFFSKENRQYMNYVQKMEEKYKTKDFAKILDVTSDKEYDKLSELTVKTPIFNKKGIENFSDSDIIRLGVVRDAVTSGEVSLKIKETAQNRHIVNSSGFIKGRSYLNEGINPQQLVEELKGTGSPIFDSEGNWTHKERVVWSDWVGTHVDVATGAETPTKNLTIIYSKAGCHIVPRRSDEQ